MGNGEEQVHNSELQNARNKYPAEQQLLIDLGYNEAMSDVLSIPYNATVEARAKVETKVKELELIHNISDNKTKKLCLIFWLKGDLSAKAYAQIDKATQKYPFLAETLIALDKQNILIKELAALALNPMEHQKKSIFLLFADPLIKAGVKKQDLKELTDGDLTSLLHSLIVLKNNEIKAEEFYVSALKNDKSGQILRLFLPVLNKIDNIEHSKKLIELLYIGIKNGSLNQGKAALAIKDVELLALAKHLHERFTCVKQMQNLGFHQEYIEMAANDDEVKGQRFRKVILTVETQCKKIHETLSGSAADKPKLKQWQQTDKEYRKALYSIAYEGLNTSNKDLKMKIKQAGNQVLAIVDPEIQSWLRKALIGIANLVIAILTVGSLHYLEKQKTGSYWFFTNTPLGKEVRKENNQLVDLINAPGLAP